MPLYEYRCEKCGERFEVIQKFSDAPLTVHVKCGGGALEKLISLPTFQLKGTGWYATDYAKGNGSAPPKQAEKSESSNDKSATAESSPNTDSSSSKDKSSSSSESKPVTPAPSAPAAAKSE